MKPKREQSETNRGSVSGSLVRPSRSRISGRKSPSYSAMNRHNSNAMRWRLPPSRTSDGQTPPEGIRVADH